jgi:hypothetical protein
MDPGHDDEYGEATGNAAGLFIAARHREYVPADTGL